MVLFYKDVSLRDLLANIIAQNDDIRASLQKILELLTIGEGMKTLEMESLKLQVASHSESIQELEQRIIELERHANVASKLARHAVTLGLAVLLFLLLNYWGIGA